MESKENNFQNELVNFDNKDKLANINWNLSILIKIYYFESECQFELNGICFAMLTWVFSDTSITSNTSDTSDTSILFILAHCALTDYGFPLFFVLGFFQLVFCWISVGTKPNTGAFTSRIIFDFITLILQLIH